LHIPTEDSIKGWERGFDGITYKIEYSTKHYYSFKTYWTPTAQDSLKEAIQVQSFIDSAFLLSNANETWRVFEKSIPFECYMNDGPSVACKILTSAEREEYIKEKKKYRRKNK
jgi:hypothetical protein